MQKLIVVVLLSIFSLQPFAREFEGMIYYKVDYELKDSRISKKEIGKIFGTGKIFYFKQGQYKWLTLHGKLKYELYNPSLSTTHTISQWNKNDTIYFKDFTHSADSVTSVDHIGREEICGINCNGIQFVLKDNDKVSMTRTLYFPVDSLQYAENYYGLQAGMGNNIIYKIGGSIPLKLVLDVKLMPFKFIYTAYKIKVKEIKQAEFEIPAKSPTVYR